ncbi:MAG: DUF1579 family protein [Thermoanaerobaculia bacterium]
MMKNIALLLAAGLVLSAAARAGAADSKPKMEAPKAPAEISSFDYFDGRWGCTGNFMGMPGMPAHAVTSSVSAVRGLGGFWHSFRYLERKTDVNPNPYQNNGFFGYDPGSKQYLDLNVDNFGGYVPEASSGWSGDVIVFTGEVHMMGKKYNQRETFTKKNASEFQHMGETQGPDGKWTKMDEETCRKP